MRSHVLTLSGRRYAISGKAIVVVLAVVLAISGSVAFAVTEQDVTLTVTIKSLGVSVSPAA